MIRRKMRKERVEMSNFVWLGKPVCLPVSEYLMEYSEKRVLVFHLPTANFP